LQVSALDDNDTGHETVARQDSDSLSLVKLNQEGMLPSAANFAKSQISVVCDFRDCKSRAIERARYDASRASTPFAQNQIAKLVTLPTRHFAHDDVSEQMLATGRRVVENPPVKGARHVGGSTILAKEIRVEC
jgi:hypothetical protein